MYVAVKGGARAIANGHRLLEAHRRGAPDIADLTVDQIRSQMALLVDRVMAEGALYDPDLAALALKQARGDAVEAIFLLRAYRTTLPRFADSRPVETGRMAVWRRISATFKDLPGGQVLGPTVDYTHRLLDFALAAEGGAAPAAPVEDPEAVPEPMPTVADLLGQEGLIEAAPADDRTPPPDLTRDPAVFPVDRRTRLQALARGDEGFLLALGYSTQRGFGNAHPFAGEIRMGTVAVEVEPEEVGVPVAIARIAVTECDMVTRFRGSDRVAPQFTRGYGLTFGHGERKAMAMALVDRALRAPELDEPVDAPAQDAEFVLQHCDAVQAAGFVEHLKLPHYVDFQAELELLRGLRAAWQAPDARQVGERGAAERGAGDREADGLTDAALAGSAPETAPETAPEPAP